MKRPSHYKEIDFIAPNIDELENYIRHELKESVFEASQGDDL